MKEMKQSSKQEYKDLVDKCFSMVSKDNSGNLRGRYALHMGGEKFVGVENNTGGWYKCNLNSFQDAHYWVMGA